MGGAVGGAVQVGGSVGGALGGAVRGRRVCSLQGKFNMFFKTSWISWGNQAENQQ